MMMRLIILTILVYLVFRILRFLFPSSPPRRSRLYEEDSRRMVNDMVQDPNCGVYVARNEAYAMRMGNGTLYFCGEECCKNYLQKKPKP